MGWSLRTFQACIMLVLSFAIFRGIKKSKKILSEQWEKLLEWEKHNFRNFRADYSVDELEKRFMTQEELAEQLYIKKATVSAYENDRFDMKVSVLKDIARVLKTTVSYLVEGETEGIAPEVMQIALMVQHMKSEELRRAAMEQVKVLVGVDKSNSNIKIVESH